MIVTIARLDQSGVNHITHQNAEHMEPPLIRDGMLVFEDRPV